jgi:hypothetical protein
LLLGRRLSTAPAKFDCPAAAEYGPAKSVRKQFVIQAKTQKE